MYGNMLSHPSWGKYGKSVNRILSTFLFFPIFHTIMVWPCQPRKRGKVQMNKKEQNPFYLEVLELQLKNRFRWICKWCPTCRVKARDFYEEKEEGQL